MNNYAKFDDNLQLLSKTFVDSDFCHKHLHTPVGLSLILPIYQTLLHEIFDGYPYLNRLENKACKL